MTVSTVEKPEVLPGCYWCRDNVGYIALWGNLGLFVVKLLCGIEGDSKALVADAVHSAVDVVTALVVLICLRVSQSPPDKEHPYGHGQVEYVSALLIGISLTVVAGFILYDGLMDIARGVTHQPQTVALLGLLISIAGNQLMFRHSYCCGTRFESPAMLANAWENRADVYSSLGALVGVVGAMLGLLFMDPLGAILVATLVGWSAFNMLRDAWHGILGSSLDESVEKRILEEANADRDVREVVFLRTRAIGTHRAVDLRIGVSPDVSLHEGHEIAERVRAAVSNRVDKAVVSVRPTGAY